MFKKNDNSLLAHKGFLTFICWFIAIMGILGGIIMLAESEDLAIPALIDLILIPLIARIIYISGILKLNFYCDVKLIRNKLYDLDNDNLESFFKETTTTSQTKATTQQEKFSQLKESMSCEDWQAFFKMVNSQSNATTQSQNEEVKTDNK